MSTVTSQSDTAQQAEDDAYNKMVESGHIGFQLAEEVRSLREEILSLKQEKRILLITNENLEEGLSKSNSALASFRFKADEQKRMLEAAAIESRNQANLIKKLESELKDMKAQMSAHKKKNKLLGHELERSLEDEVALRGYSRRLESDVAASKERISHLESNLKDEIDERLRCQRFIETALRSQLVLQKKLETVCYYTDKDVDLTAVSILDVSPDYLDNLLRDLRSDVLPANGHNNVAKYDFTSLEHRQRNIDHQQNQHLNNIRNHVARMRRVQMKSRKYIRQLLDVIYTYEELPVMSTTHREKVFDGTASDSDYCERVELVGNRKFDEEDKVGRKDKKEASHRKLADFENELISKGRYSVWRQSRDHQHHHDQVENADTEHHPRQRSTQPSNRYGNHTALSSSLHDSLRRNGLL